MKTCLFIIYLITITLLISTSSINTQQQQRKSPDEIEKENKEFLTKIMEDMGISSEDSIDKTKLKGLITRVLTKDKVIDEPNKKMFIKKLSSKLVKDANDLTPFSEIPAIMDTERLTKKTDEVVLELYGQETYEAYKKQMLEEQSDNSNTSNSQDSEVVSDDKIDL